MKAGTTGKLENAGLREARRSMRWQAVRDGGTG